MQINRNLYLCNHWEIGDKMCTWMSQTSTSTRKSGTQILDYFWTFSGSSSDSECMNEPIVKHFRHKLFPLTIENCSFTVDTEKCGCRRIQILYKGIDGSARKPAPLQDNEYMVEKTI